MSARTRDGRFSPIRGFPTSTTANSCTGSAMRAHPPNTTSPSSDAHGSILMTASSMSWRISSVEFHILLLIKINLGSSMELTSRFQPEQIQIPIKIIMQREELQVQLGKCQTSVASEILIGHNILVPDDGFGRVQRHLVQRFELGNATFMARNLLKCAKVEKSFFFVVQRFYRTRRFLKNSASNRCQSNGGFKSFGTRFK